MSKAAPPPRAANPLRSLSAGEKFLEEAINTHIAGSVKIALADEPISVNELFPQDLQKLQQWKSRKRRDSWLRGRKALRRLLKSLEENQETEKISFPNPRFSLTHSGKYALAAGTAAATYPGIGIDFEQSRWIAPEAARFFLNKTELDWLTVQDAAVMQKHLLRFWTLKEALLKSWAGNGRKSLTRFVLTNPSEWHGEASLQDCAAVKFSFVSLQFEEGFVSAAVCLPPDDTL